MANGIDVDKAKLQVGTGDIDNSENITLGNNSTLNKTANIKVESGATLKYEDADTIRAKQAARMETWDKVKSEINEIGRSIHEKSFSGKMEKLGKEIETGLDNLTGVNKTKASRFDNLNFNAPSPTSKSATDEMSL